MEYKLSLRNRKTCCFLMSQKYKNTRNNYSNIFIVLGALKSLFCFPLDIDINDILNYRMNYLLRKCRKKAIPNKQDCLNTRLLIVTFHLIAKNYDSELKTQVRFIRYFYEPYRGITEVPSLEILSNDLSIVMKDFHLYSWLLSYDLSKILAKLVISLKNNIIFAKFREILLDNNLNCSHTHIR